MKTVAITLHFVGTGEYVAAWDDAQEALDWCRASTQHKPRLYLKNSERHSWDKHELDQSLPVSKVEF